MGQCNTDEELQTALIKKDVNVRNGLDNIRGDECEPIDGHCVDLCCNMLLSMIVIYTIYN